MYVVPLRRTSFERASSVLGALKIKGDCERSNKEGSQRQLKKRLWGEDAIASARYVNAQHVRAKRCEEDLDAFLKIKALKKAHVAYLLVIMPSIIIALFNEQLSQCWHTTNHLMLNSVSAEALPVRMYACWQEMIVQLRQFIINDK
jgi:hypothetical protein